MIIAAAAVLLCVAGAILLIPRYSPFQLTLNAVKLDAQGNNLGTAQLQMRGSVYEYAFRPKQMEVAIADFDGFTGVGESTSRSGSYTEIMQSPIASYEYITMYALSRETGQMEFLTLAFTADLDWWMLLTSPTEAYFACVSGNTGTEELVDLFRPFPQ